MQKGSELKEHNALVERLQQIKKLADECLADLTRKSGKRRTGKNPMKPKVAGQTAQHIDFKMPIRAIVKRYGRGLTGAAKFVLIVACLAKGDASIEVARSEVQKQWNKMKSQPLLGMKFAQSYASRALENDWVGSAKRGTYSLRPSWREAMTS